MFNEHSRIDNATRDVVWDHEMENASQCSSFNGIFTQPQMVSVETKGR